MLMSRKSELPYGYTRCEYLESTGTQWINTEVVPYNVYFKSEEKAQYTNTHRQQHGCITADRKYLAPIGIYEGNFFCQIDKGVNVLRIADTSRHVFVTDFKNGIAYIDDISYTITKDFAHTNIRFYIFARSLNGEALTKNYKKCWYYNIYIDDILTRNFIPALDPTGRPCMYDTITKQPFYNQGTGEFLYKLE